MKTRIESGRFWRHRFILLLLAIAAIVGIQGTAQAQTSFTVPGSHNLTWTQNGLKYISIERTGGYGYLFVSGTLSGSSNFSFPYSNAAMWMDSSRDTAWRFDSLGYIAVNFSSSQHDTTHAMLVLLDSSGGNNRDTLYLTGIGPDSNVVTIDSLPFGVYLNLMIDVAPDSSSAWGELTNRETSSTIVVATLSDSSYWNIDNLGGSETFSLNTTTDRSPGRNFLINFTPHGVYEDSVMVTFRCNSPVSETRSFWVYAYDRTYAPVYYEPTIDYPNLGVITPGDTVCGTIVISNQTSQTIAITNVQTNGTSGDWTWGGLPTTPYSLAPGDTTRLTACWHPTYYGEYGYLYLATSYRDSSGLTGTVGGTGIDYARGVTPACLEGLNDSIQLDDVIEGGYVEGTATFIVHKDSILTAGSIVGWDCTAEILSPTLPMTLNAGDTISIHFRVTPRADTGGWFGGEIPLTDGSCSTQISFEGNAVDSSSRALSLFSDQTELLALRSSTTTVTKTFDFVNSSGLTERVTSVSLANGSHFSITGYDPHAPVDTLYSNDQLGITLQFDANTTGFYQDSLTIVTEAGLSTPVIHRFNVEAIREASSGVTLITMQSPVDITLSPNPSQGLVSISIGNAARAQVEVFDLLGSKLANVPNVSTSSYTWNAGNLPNGIYIVRASGADENGNAFVISKRLVLER
jgi:hypothetical protein